jgi:hypothetical protein
MKRNEKKARMCLRNILCQMYPTQLANEPERYSSPEDVSSARNHQSSSARIKRQKTTTEAAYIRSRRCIQLGVT